MLDPKCLRGDIQQTAEKLERRGFKLDVNSFIELEEKRKSLQIRTQELQNERKVRSKSIGKAKASGEDITPLLAEVGNLGDELDSAKAELTVLLEEIAAQSQTIPNLPDDLVVELPAYCDASGIQPIAMKPIPEGIAATIRLHASIHQLLVEAYDEQSKDKLLQAILIEPTVNSYRNAVDMCHEMLTLQKEVLPPLN